MSNEKKAEKPGLWANIRAKRERGGKPAQPGDADYPAAKSWKKVTSISAKKEASSPAWQRSEGKNEEGGLNAKGRASYNKSTGGNLKAPVTEKNPKGDRAKRQNSFCARMCGMKKHETGSKTKKDPDSRINKSLRKWNCKCGSEKQAEARVTNPLIPALLGVAGGGVVGGLSAPKGKLLEYILGGAGIGGSTGLLAGTGRSLGALGANALVANQGLTGNSAAAAELGLPIAGILSGGLLSLPVVRRINEELAYHTDEEEENKMAALNFGTALQKQALGVGTVVGTLGGLATGRPGRRMRAVGRGAVKGIGFDLGATVGAPLGGLLGLPFGVPGMLAGGVVGGLGGGTLGTSAASSLLGPDETDEEKFERLLAAREAIMAKYHDKTAAYAFGAKLAADTLKPIDGGYVAQNNMAAYKGGDESKFTPAMNVAAGKPAVTPPAPSTPSLPHSYSSTSTGNSTNPPPGAWSGKHSVPVGSSALVPGQIASDVAERANRYAGNESVGPNFQPKRILGPAMHPYMVPTSIFSTGETLRYPSPLQDAENSIRHTYSMSNMQKYKDRAERPQQNMASMFKTNSARDFGAKLAAVTTCAAPKHNDQSGVDVNPAAAGTPEGKEKLTKKKLPLKAEDVVGKKAEALVNFVERKPKEPKAIRNGGNLNPVAAGEEHEDVPEEAESHDFDKLSASKLAAIVYRFTQNG